ncbi:MAG: hypothetical protein WBJ83_07800 [Thermacetogeniaceae bacterium]|jgi:hypothetical protein|nr:hypothetical protein [Syntrophomonadaceae bacterium]
MGRRHLQLVIVLGIIFVYLAATVGCSQPQSKPVPEQSSEGRVPVPSELKQLQASLDQLYEELKPELPQTGGNQQQGGQTGQQNSEQGGQQEGQTDQGQQQGKGDNQQDQGGQADQVDWNKLQSQAEKIHDQWNRFETKAVEAGARQADIDGIEEELDKLPMMITAKNRSGARLAVNKAAAYLPNFMELYSTKAPPALYLMQVLTRNVMSKVDDGDWGGAEQDMLKMKTTWSQLLVQLKDESKAETDKTHMAQLDLEDALQKRDQLLVLIKGNILEKNLDDLIKKQEAKM